ncbi:thioredoxin-like protein [Chitinophaga dinghuensis]|uniref:Thioredoxin-like protein n=1 Tax=Chitinophaga dinghuensis TaxID=1539050 RepID=A0A327VRC3_9BACT|nr:TlpA disulfide reductase family protein [Chitinophaga dinghuensis]RAJ76629.1 thioredoxin-like protein [Chitinophaga dinghuensis]
MISFRIKLTCVVLVFLLPLFAMAQFDKPFAKVGTVKISGSVSIPRSIMRDSIKVWISVPQPFTGDVGVYKVPLDFKGQFALNVNTETNISRCVISTDININNQVTMLLQSGQESTISFGYNDDGVINRLKTNYNAGFTDAELIDAQNQFNNMINERSGKPMEPLYNKDFSVFVDHTNSVLLRKRSILDRTTVLSKKMKDIQFKDFSLATYYNDVFNYHTVMVFNYSATNNHKMPDSTDIKTPVRKDYIFLKNLDLNNPMNLYCFSYPTFTQELLRNNTLNIPRIGDTPIHEWTKTIKAIIGDLTGFDKGQFYDMLISNAYAMQFDLELKPLTNTQLQNITQYYKGSELQKILLKKNQEVADMARLKEEMVLNTTPDVSPEALMNAIIARYKGKTVVVDFWATWCAPCLEAIKASREYKKQLADKDVVFVYISSPSSPKKLWEKHIQGIGGQQFYLTQKEWNYLLDTFHFSGIPSYLIFDNKGVLKHQFTAYPGNELMQKKIESVAGVQ